MSVPIATRHRLCGQGDAVLVDDRDQGIELVIQECSTDGKFQTSVLKVVARSFVELGQLDSEPDLTKYYAEEFLPKK